MNKAILEITDGTTTVSLVDKNNGFWLVDWEPSINLYKSGGVFTDPALADFRQLKTKQWATAIETMRLHISTPKADTTAYQLQQLLRLLQKANNYWMSRWQSDPVWVKAQAKCETNPRYCLLVKGEIPEYGNPYRQPFLGKRATIRNISLVLERQHWLENAPGTGTAVAISALEAYDGRNYGNVDSTGTREPTTANEVYVANKRNEANLTDVYVDDGGVFGSNLLNAALPQSLLPGTPATNDAIYFGIDTSLSDSGPFSSLVFDIGTAGSGYTGVWEYWNSAAWSTLSILNHSFTDNTDGGTNPFENTGVNSVHWEHPSNWATTSVNGVTGYWVRMRVSGTTAPSPPTQQNRRIYSIVWNYIEVQATAIEGDIPALIQQKVYDQADNSNPSNTNLYMVYERVVVGLRSISRGTNFTSIINLSDEQNPTGITAGSADANVTVSNDIVAPTGRVLVWNPAGATSDDLLLTVAISSSLSKEYQGRFRVYMRINQSGGTLGDFTFRIRGGSQIAAGYYAYTYISELVGFTAINAKMSVLDFGEVVIGDNLDDDEAYVNGYVFTVYGTNTEAATPGDITFYDLCLIPIDEYAYDVLAVVPDTVSTAHDLSVKNGEYLDVNGIHPKRWKRSSVKDVTDDDIKLLWKTISPGYLIAQANTRQRYHFLFMRGGNDSLTYWVGVPAQASSVLLNCSQRYLALRGDR